MKPNFGKRLFPRLQPDQRQREIRVWLAVLLVGLAVAAVMATVMILVEKGKLS